MASAAVPGLAPTAVSSAPDDAADFDSALLLDSAGKRWRVRSPKHVEASTRLETELLVLKVFSPAIRAELPFLMPTVAGTLRQGQLTTFVYSHLSGSPRSIESLTAGSARLSRELGATMAAIHDLPPGIVQDADLPSYTGNEFRQRKLNELDQAATTGEIPASLLRRWEHALEDVALWRFNPCVVHGDLHEDNILIEGERVMAVTGWTDLRVGDPADDFAWLVAANDQKFIDSVLEAYSASRREAPDRHLIRRAALSAEFALAQWLVKGVAAGDQQMVAEAKEMLAALESDITEYGGQPISVEPPPARDHSASGATAVAPPGTAAEPKNAGTPTPPSAAAARPGATAAAGSPGSGSDSSPGSGSAGSAAQMRPAAPAVVAVPKVSVSSIPVPPLDVPNAIPSAAAPSDESTETEQAPGGSVRPLRPNEERKPEDTSTAAIQMVRSHSR